MGYVLPFSRNICLQLIQKQQQASTIPYGWTHHQSLLFVTSSHPWLQVVAVATSPGNLVSSRAKCGRLPLDEHPWVKERHSFPNLVHKSTLADKADLTEMSIILARRYGSRLLQNAQVVSMYASLLPSFICLDTILT